MRVRCPSWRTMGALVLIFGLVPTSASAQLVFESVGERALGMGGAFVAVADDATAVHWNPAGLGTGPFAGMTIGWHGFHVGNRDAPPEPGVSSGRGSLTSLGTLPIGISYGSVQRTRLSEPLDPQEGGHTAESLRVSHLGVTILQGVIEGLVVGSTVKVIRGGFATGRVDHPTTGSALEAGTELDAGRRTTFDLDIGVMASAPRLRVGLAVKNLRSPSFRAAAGSEITLPRQARAGLTVLPVNGLTLAMDLDLNTVDLMGDLRRNLAVGGESAIGTRVQVRSGVRWNLAGDRGVVGAVGASVSVRRGIWIDGHYAAGRSDEARELGVALRAGF